MNNKSGHSVIKQIYLLFFLSMTFFSVEVYSAGITTESRHTQWQSLLFSTVLLMQWNDQKYSKDEEENGLFSSLGLDNSVDECIEHIRYPYELAELVEEYGEYCTFIFHIPPIISRTAFAKPGQRIIGVDYQHSFKSSYVDKWSYHPDEPFSDSGKLQPVSESGLKASHGIPFIPTFITESSTDILVLSQDNYISNIYLATNMLPRSTNDCHLSGLAYLTSKNHTIINVSTDLSEIPCERIKESPRRKRKNPSSSTGAHSQKGSPLAPAFSWNDIVKRTASKKLASNGATGGDDDEDDELNKKIRQWLKEQTNFSSDSISNIGISDSDETPKRPMNAFMCFAKIFRPVVAGMNPNVHNSILSKWLGTLWRLIDPETKQVFVDLSIRLSEEHKNKYPNFKYGPKAKKTTIHHSPGYGSGASFPGAYPFANYELSSMTTTGLYSAPLPLFTSTFDSHPGNSVGSAANGFYGTSQTATHQSLHPWMPQPCPPYGVEPAVDGFHGAFHGTQQYLHHEMPHLCTPHGVGSAVNGLPEALHGAQQFLHDEMPHLCTPHGVGSAANGFYGTSQTATHQSLHPWMPQPCPPYGVEPAVDGFHGAFHGTQQYLHHEMPHFCTPHGVGPAASGFQGASYDQSGHPGDVTVESIHTIDPRALLNEASHIHDLGIPIGFHDEARRQPNEAP